VRAIQSPDVPVPLERAYDPFAKIDHEGHLDHVVEIEKIRGLDPLALRDIWRLAPPDGRAVDGQLEPVPTTLAYCAHWLPRGGKTWADRLAARRAAIEVGTRTSQQTAVAPSDVREKALI